ncbi:hypothetical protein FH972_013009 [Carpinus fangiana]|uniref:Uncharacterized protein n=1 Tax=Carpinus fangiana TaxID=176857 RepID=A0A5N6R8T0_9ROSI|nr:hypothetical protein FH972_013009 [Carpinus fangiana]
MNCTCCSRHVIVPKPIQNKTFASPIGVRLIVPHGTTAAAARSTSSRVCPVRASIVDSYESSFNFANRMEKAWLISQESNVRCNKAYTLEQSVSKEATGKGNQGLLVVLLATQMDTLNANGVGVLDSLFLVITCSAKSPQETPVVLFVVEWDQCVALIVREQAFVPSG